MTSGPTPKISRKKMRYLYQKLTKNYLVENLGPKPTGNPSELIFVLFGGFWGPFFIKPLNCQFSKGVPYMILELCKCGKSFSQIYKAYNFLKDHVRHTIMDGTVALHFYWSKLKTENPKSPWFQPMQTP